MVEPIYVPALPARKNSLEAYEGLAPPIRAAVAPLWTIPPRVGPARARGYRTAFPLDLSPGLLTQYLRGMAISILNAQQEMPAWVDAFHVEGQAEPVTAGLWTLLAQSPVRLVTGIDRAEWQQVACARLARDSRNGLGIRIQLTDLPDERDVVALQRLLYRFGTQSLALDLLLDVGSVTDEHHQADKWALRAVDLLGALYSWRTVVVLAGAFPRVLPDDAAMSPVEAHRFDWDVWHMVRHAREGQSRHIAYGDYGAQHTSGADQPSTSGGGPPWGVLRYTTERTFLVAKAPTVGPGRTAAVRSLARQIVGTDDYRGARFSDGDLWFADCARLTGKEGTGNAGIWAGVGHNQHMTYVVEQLSAAAT